MLLLTLPIAEVVNTVDELLLLLHSLCGDVLDAGSARQRCKHILMSLDAVQYLSGFQSAWPTDH